MNVPNMITIFRYFDNVVLICLKMSFFVITATTTQNANLKKIKNRKQSIDAQYI